MRTPLTTPSVDLVVAYMGALKAGATVSVLDPQYPADRQKVLLEVANPTFLVQIRRATEDAGKLADSVAEFIASNLKIKAEVPALCLGDDGELSGGDIVGTDCLQAQAAVKGEAPGVLVGPDSAPTLSFTSGSEGKPKGVLGRHFSLTYYFPWMSEKFGLSENDKFTMLSGIAHDPIQVGSQDLGRNDNSKANHFHRETSLRRSSSAPRSSFPLVT